MNLETLHLYCDIVRFRSFSRGASTNGVSQSAASQAVRQLEADVDVRLLDRSKRPFALTPEGRAFYEGCRDLLQQYEKVRARIASARSRLSGPVRVAAIYSVGLHEMSRHVQPFMSQYPEAKVHLECLHPHKVIEAVLNDEADVGVMSYPPSNRALAVLPWRSERMVLVCHPNHRLAHRRIVRAEELQAENFVGFDPDLAIRRAIDRALKQRNVKVNVVMEFDNIETIKQAIAIAAGVSILPGPTVLKEVRIGTLAASPLDIPHLVRPVGIVYRRQKPLTPIVSRFIESLQKAAGEAEG
ncbi:MAG: LysR family transcriptional regulator [Candidatus Rokubacteria bacterium]|nr:LysR family transcriptional regulator [Candidatus Rokubacteria bacterium]